jgi:hypothetical protein
MSTARRPDEEAAMAQFRQIGTVLHSEYYTGASNYNSFAIVTNILRNGKVIIQTLGQITTDEHRSDWGITRQCMPDMDIRCLEHIMAHVQSETSHGNSRAWAMTGTVARRDIVYWHLYDGKPKRDASRFND